MNVLIIGCEKLGAGLANTLSQKGHDVVVICGDAEEFTRLDDGFSGFTVTGVPFDLETLEKGGIQSCDCLAAVTGDDNINIVVSQIARDIYQVPQVITRIHDPRKNALYSAQGLHTISPTALAVEMLDGIIDDHDSGSRAQANFGNFSLGMQSMEVPKEFFKTRLADVPHSASEQIIGVEQQDGSVLFLTGNEDYRFQSGDRLIFSKVLAEGRQGRS